MYIECFVLHFIAQQQNEQIAQYFFYLNKILDLFRQHFSSHIADFAPYDELEKFAFCKHLSKVFPLWVIFAPILIFGFDRLFFDRLVILKACFHFEFNPYFIFVPILISRKNLCNFIGTY